MRLEKGTKAPDFSMDTDGGGKVSLSDYKGKKLVLYFYPKDDTPGCTKESCSFRDNLSTIQAKGTEVLGVSPDGVASHEKFKEKFSLNFPLGADEDHSVAESYGAWGEKNMYGNVTIGLIRSTFLIDEEGNIQRAWYNVRVNGHVEKVMEEIG